MGKQVTIIISAVFCAALVLAEDCTLLSNVSHVTCVCEDSNGPIIIDPPEEEAHRKTNVSKDIKSINDDWIAHSESTSTVIDDRWLDFPTLFEHTIIFNGSTKTIPFSVYGPFKISTYMKNVDRSASSLSTILSKLDNAWYHYKFNFKNETVIEIYENDNLIDTPKYSQNATSIFLKNINQTKTYWKKHQISGKWSNKPSMGPTTLIIPSKYSCLELYVKLCHDCDLEISHNSEKMTIMGNGNENLWQKLTLDLAPAENTTVTLLRTKNGENMEGFWYYDLRSCSPPIAVRKVAHEKKHHTCQILNEKLSANITRKMNLLSNDKPGAIGNKLCSDVLGSTYPFCDKHLICLKETPCICAWGSKGPDCSKDCEIGKWGLNCQQNCTCSHCNPKSGSCPGSKEALVVLGIIVAIVLIIVGIKIAITLFTTKHTYQQVDEVQQKL